MSLAREELDNLKWACKRTKLVPKAGELVLVKFNFDSVNSDGKDYCYSIGFTMQHIDGGPVGDRNLSRKNSMLLSKARKRLWKDGVYQEDGHDFNVVMKKKAKRNKFIFVDASSFCEFHGDYDGQENTNESSY